MSDESRDPPEPEDLIGMAICSPSMRFGKEDEEEQDE